MDTNATTEDLRQQEFTISGARAGPASNAGPVRGDVASSGERRSAGWPRGAPRGSPLLTRVRESPLLEPTRSWWETDGVFNPAVAVSPDGAVHLLYRAQGRDRVSRLGYARLSDPVTVAERQSEPVFEPALDDEYERLGTEDPRMVRIGSTYYITYVAASLYRASDPHPAWLPAGEPSWRVRVALATTDDFRTFRRHGIILPEMDNKDAVLFPEKIGGEYLLLHRLPPDIWLAASGDLRTWREHRIVLRTRPALWDEHKLGAGPPPVRTDAGWLVCYHGVDHHLAYRAGFALLDLKDPGKVLARSDHAALEPTMPWEVKGQTARVVFPTGMVVRGDDLFLYYGGADRVVGVARGSVKEILASLR